MFNYISPRRGRLPHNSVKPHSFLPSFLPLPRFLRTGTYLSCQRVRQGNFAQKLDLYSEKLVCDRISCSPHSVEISPDVEQSKRQVWISWNSSVIGECRDVLGVTTRETTILPKGCRSIQNGVRTTGSGSVFTMTGNVTARLFRTLAKIKIKKEVIKIEAILHERSDSRRFMIYSLKTY